MSEADFGSLALLLFLLIAAAHVLGYLFTRLRQPRVIGEILAGVLLGPSLLGRFLPFAGTGVSDHSTDVALGALYHLGLLLLMLLAGAETRRLFDAADRRQTLWLAAIGTAVPFALMLAASPYLPLSALMGTAGQTTALALVLSAAVAVTSIPVISRIFHDLGILRTRFARLVLGAAVLEDLALWAVLAVATALAGSAMASPAQISVRVAATLAYFATGLTLLPCLIRRLNAHRHNLLLAASPIGYVVAVLLAYAALASVLGVSLVFAAFLAGFAVAGEHERFRGPLDALSRTSYAVFIPVYFAVVGLRLDLSRSLSLTLLIVFLVGSSAIKLASAGLGARLAGFRGLDAINLAIATNARGGPGIVIASIAYDAGIISSAFYTALVLTAVLTSQAAGAWLEHLLRRGVPLLQTAERAPVVAEPPAELNFSA